jgi:hypothetical protein
MQYPRRRPIASPLEAFRRRPRARGPTVMGPASETLHNTGGPAASLWKSCFAETARGEVLHGTWEVSSMPGLVCRAAGWGRRQAARYYRGLVAGFAEPSFDELKSVAGLAEGPTSCTAAPSDFLRAT